MSIRLYFAHPINIYDTPIERAMMTLIAHTFPTAVIENPNQPHHQVGYTAYAKRAREAETAHKGMNYFYDEVLPLCAGVVAAPYLDNKFGLGVVGETSWFGNRALPAFALYTPDHMVWADYEDFTHNPLNGFFKIRHFTRHELMILDMKDPKMVVPHLETRLRTWIIYNRIMREYDGAHLVSMPLPNDFYLPQ